MNPARRKCLDSALPFEVAYCKINSHYLGFVSWAPLFGVGTGWMAVAFPHDFSDNDIVTTNSQSFLFKPRPNEPAIDIGGPASYSIDRVLLKYDNFCWPVRCLGKVAL